MVRGAREVTPSPSPNERDWSFIYRPLHNARDLLRWARRERFRGLIQARDLHVTLAKATAADVVTMRRGDLLIVPAGGERALLGFGEGLVALAFASPELTPTSCLARA